MKKFLFSFYKSLLVPALLIFSSNADGQTIFAESMYNGTGGSSGNSISTHESNNRFEHDELTFSGSGDMRDSNPSSGYVGASGTWNVLLNPNGTGATENFVIDGINATSYTDIVLWFGIRKATNASNGSELKVEYSVDGGGSFSPVDWDVLPTGSGTATWVLRSTTSVIPSDVTTIRFTATNYSSGFNIDDVKLQGTLGSDTTAPTVTNFSPLDNATNVGVNSNLVMTFDENVKAGTAGNIVIYNGSGTVFETIPYNDSRITYSGKTATINPTGTFANSSDYYVQIANTAITDTAGNAYAGINDTTSWNFTTVAITYSVTVSQATGGTIVPGTQSGIASGSNSSAFTATPASCYTFAGWTIDGSPNASTVNPYTFTNVTANHTLTAVYTIKTNSITASAGINGSISPNGVTAVNCGASQTYNITPNSGYVVDDVLVDGVSVGPVTTYTFTNVTAAHSISATFKVYVGPCLVENFDGGTRPTGWIDAGSGGPISYSSNYADISANTGYVTMRSLANPSSLTFDLSRTGNGTLKNLNIEISTTSQTSGFTAIANYDHNNTTQNGTTACIVDLSSFTGYPVVYIRFNKTSGSTSPWRIDNVKVFCGTSTPTVSQPTDHFRSKQIGSWTAFSTWESSANGSTGWIDADLIPTSSATSITIRNGHQVTINTGGVSMTNTTVESGGILEVTTTSSFDLSGTGSGRNIQLTIKNNGQFLVNSPSNFSIPTGNASGLVETGGKLIAGPNMGSSSIGNTGSAFSDAYLGKNNGIFYFGDAAICEWACPHTTLGSATPTDTDFFFPDNPTDMPIFRVTTSPAFEFGSNSTNNVFNSILEVISPAVFQIGKGGSSGSAGTKRFIGGVRGTGIITQNPTPSASNTGNIFLGDDTHVPVLDGSISLNIQNNRLKLPNGANVPVGANVTIMSSAENNSIDRQGGNLIVNGSLDITNLRITNTSTGGISINNGGILKTRNTGGLYGTGAAITGGTLDLNIGNTIDYYADVNQKISTGKQYYNIIFSGSGGVKTPSNATLIDVHTDGKVTITGNPTVDFTSNNLASTSANNTKFDMDGGRLILGTAQLLPNMRGSYNITGGTIEFTANAFGIRTPNTYHNIEITVPVNKEVTYAGGNLTLNPGASVLVKSNATLTSTSGNASLVGTTANMLTVESGATFKTAVTSGFYGPSGLPNLSPSVRDNITLDLKPGSTVEYARLSGEFGLPVNSLSGHQIITPITTGYQNLHISGDGIKTAKGEITVNEMTSVSSASATLLVPEYDILTNPVYSVFYALSGISNTNGTSGNFVLGNDAQLMQNATAINTNAKIEAQRKLSLTEDRKEYNYLISPVEGQDMKSIIGEDAGNIQFVTKINEATSLFVNAGDGPYVKGLAYAVKETVPTYNDPGFDVAKFKGRPFNEDLDFHLYKTANSRGYNLSGNPYPSNLDLDALYTASSNIESTFRFWDNKVNNIYVQQGGGYQGYSYAFYNAPNGTGVAAPGGNGMSATGREPNHILKVGQGFIIRVKAEAPVVAYPGTAATLSYRNSQRIIDQTDAEFFGKNADKTTKDRYWLEYVTPANLVINNAVVYFVGGNNLFSADDTRFPGSSDALYTMAEETKVLINGRSPFEISDRISIGIKAFTAGTYKIRVGKREGIFAAGQSIYLKDKELGIVTDLTGGDYTFASGSGEFTNRFEIVYKPSIVLAADDASRTPTEVYRDGSDFVVKSDRTVEQVEIFDASGRLLLTLSGTSREIRFSASYLAEGIYVLKAQLKGGDTVTKKIRK